MKLSGSARRGFLTGGVVLLLVALCLELGFSVRSETQTWDEACHLFAGYNYWTRGDFGVNPEHPPLVKLLAATPLLAQQLSVPERRNIFSKEEDFVSAKMFLYSGNADQILFRARMAASFLTLLLGILLFCAAKEMFGQITAFIALTLFVLEPNILAHGALVTTDMGITCFLFATVYAFYRYVKRPSRKGLLLTSMAAGLTLATKHSGILIFLILVALTLIELLRRRRPDVPERESLVHETWRLARAIVVVGVISVAVLWASYGFRSEPRSAVDAAPKVVAYVERLDHPLQRKLITMFARWHLLPEPYLYGLADVGFTAAFSHTYLFGKVYTHGQWFYFPAAFLIKTTVALLILLLLVPIAIALRGPERKRELWFLVVPVVIYFGVAMLSGMNIGIRHILPIYPFLMILAAWPAAELIRRKRRWAYAVALLLAVDAFSSLHVFPVYLAYANELWGGPANTYKYLSDSNVDWGQQLKAIKMYLDERHVKNCWFAYFGDVVADPAKYGIPCKPLTTIASVWLLPSVPDFEHSLQVPPSIDGTVLISAGVLSGYEFGPGALNPYDQFQRLRPTAVIEHGVFVFDGHFDIPLASALDHVTQAQILERDGHIDQALAQAQIAAQLAPDSMRAQAEYGQVLMKLNRADEGRQALQRALALAETVRPEFQQGWVPGLRAELGQ